MNRRLFLNLAAGIGTGLALRRTSQALQSGSGLVELDLAAKAGWFPLAGGLRPCARNQCFEPARKHQKRATAAADPQAHRANRIYRSRD